MAETCSEFVGCHPNTLVVSNTEVVNRDLPVWPSTVVVSDGKSLPVSSLRERLEQARGELKWSMREMSRQAGLTSETHYQLIVRRLAAGSSADVELDTVTKLASALERHGYSPEWVLHGRGSPKSQSAPARVTEYTARYPNREAAIRQLVDEGKGSEEDVRAAADLVGVALKSETDPAQGDWYAAIRRALRGVLEGREELGVRPARDEDFEG
jgi:hypothetical protein